MNASKGHKQLKARKALKKIRTRSKQRHKGTQAQRTWARKACRHLDTSLLNCVSYVPTYQRALRAYVLTCQRALCAYGSCCNVPCVLSCSRAGVFCMFKCSRGNSWNSVVHSCISPYKRKLLTGAITNYVPEKSLNLAITLRVNFKWLINGGRWIITAAVGRIYIFIYIYIYIYI